MGSPGASPSHGLQGASRVTGGFMRGRAQGNFFNFADASDNLPSQSTPVTGKVHLYFSDVDPTTTRPNMSLTHELTADLAPVLTSLGELLSPIHSKCSHSMIGLIYDSLLEKNQHICTYEDNIWSIKGRYATAMEKNDKVEWILQDRKYILPLRIVSIVTIHVLGILIEFSRPKKMMVLRILPLLLPMQEEEVLPLEEKL